MAKQTILIIENDKFFKELITKKLEAEGFSVAMVGDSKEAFKYLEETVPSLIILDLILPGMDGYDILSILKKDKKLSSIPVVILSNLGQKEEIDRAMSLGVDEFLVKVNFVPEEIVEKIKSVIQRKYL